MTEPTLIKLLEDFAEGWDLLAENAAFSGDYELSERRGLKAVRLRAAAARLRSEMALQKMLRDSAPVGSEARELPAFAMILLERINNGPLK